MRKDFKRFISKIVAGTMLITTVFGNVAIAAEGDTAGYSFSNENGVSYVTYNFESMAAGAVSTTESDTFWHSNAPTSGKVDYVGIVPKDTQFKENGTDVKATAASAALFIGDCAESPANDGSISFNSTKSLGDAGGTTDTVIFAGDDKTTLENYSIEFDLSTVHLAGSGQTFLNIYGDDGNVAFGLKQCRPTSEKIHQTNTEGTELSGDNRLAVPITFKGNSYNFCDSDTAKATLSATAQKVKYEVTTENGKQYVTVSVGGTTIVTKQEVANASKITKIEFMAGKNGNRGLLIDNLKFPKAEPQTEGPEEPGEEDVKIPDFTYTSESAITVKAENGLISVSGNDIIAHVDSTTSAAVEIKFDSELTVTEIVASVLNAITTADGYDADKVKAESKDNAIEFTDVAKSEVIGSITFTKATVAKLSLPIKMSGEDNATFIAALGNSYSSSSGQLTAEFDDSANTGFIFPVGSMKYSNANYGAEVLNYGDNATTVQYKAKEAGVLTITVGMGSLQSSTNVSFKLANGTDVSDAVAVEGEKEASASIEVAKDDVVTLSFSKTDGTGTNIFVKSLNAETEEFVVPDFTYADAETNPTITVKVENGVLNVTAAEDSAYSYANGTITITVAEDATEGEAIAVLAQAIKSAAEEAGATVTVSKDNKTVTIAHAKDATKNVEIKLVERTEGSEPVVELMSASYTGNDITLTITDDELKTLTGGTVVNTTTGTIEIPANSELTPEALATAIAGTTVTNGTATATGATVVFANAKTGVEITITITKATGEDPDVDNSPAFSVTLGGLTISVDKDGKATATGTDAIYSFANNTVSIAASADAAVTPATVIAAIEKAATDAQGEKVTVTKTDSSITVASKANEGKSVTINVRKSSNVITNTVSTWSTSGTAGESIPTESQDHDGKIYIHNVAPATYTADGGIQFGGGDDNTTKTNGHAYFDFEPITSGKVSLSADLVLNESFSKPSRDMAILEVHGKTATDTATTGTDVAIGQYGGKWGIKGFTASNKAIVAGERVHVEFIIDLDEDTLQLYVNGEKVSDTATAVTPAAATVDQLESVERAAFFVRAADGAVVTAYDVELATEAGQEGPDDPNPPATKGGLTVTADNETPNVGDTVTVTYNLKGLTGINNYTWFLNYNPEVVKATRFIGPDAGAEDTYVSYTLPEVTGRGLLVPVDVANGQLALPPAADDKDYAGLGADGTKTAAELGRIKLSHLTGNTSGNGAIGATDKDGILFKVEFEVVGGGSADIELVPVDGVALFYNEPESGTGAKALDSQLETKETSATVVAADTVEVEGLPTFDVTVGTGADTVRIKNNPDEGGFTATGFDSATNTMTILANSAVSVKDVLDALKANADLADKVTVSDVTETEDGFTATFTIDNGTADGFTVTIVKDKEKSEDPNPPAGDVTVTVRDNTLNIAVGDDGITVTGVKGVIEKTENGAIVPINGRDVAGTVSYNLKDFTTADFSAEGATVEYDANTATLKVTIGTKTYDLQLYRYGDVNIDGAIAATDATTIIAYLNASEEEKEANYTQRQRIAANVLNDAINAVGATSIISYLNDNTFIFNAEK